MTTKTKTTWRKVKLGEVADINMGQSPSSRFYTQREEGLPFYQGVTDFGEKYPKKSIYCTNPIKIANAGDIFFSVRAPVGDVNIAIERSCIGRGVASLKTKNGNNDFLYFLLKNYSKHFKGVAGGTTYESINKDQIEDMEFFVPDAPSEQKRIAEILSAFDDKIELNNKIIKTLEEIGSAIFKEWFAVPSEALAEGGELPRGWDVRKIGKVTKVVLGGTPSRSKPEYWGGNIPWINSGKTNEFRIISASEYITESGLKNSNAQLMPKRTTVIAITGATLGQVSLLEIEAAANQSVVGVFGSDVLSPEVIYLYIKNKIQEIIQNATGGAQQHINKGVVEDYPIIVPEEKISVSFNKIILPIFDQISNLVFENQTLASLRDLLLPKLMNGEIRV